MDGPARNTLSKRDKTFLNFPPSDNHIIMELIIGAAVTLFVEVGNSSSAAEGGRLQSCSRPPLPRGVLYARSQHRLLGVGR